MNVEYTGRHYQVEDAVRDFTSGKLEKVTKWLDEPIEVHAVFEVEKHRHRAELNVVHRHGAYRAAEVADEMLDAIHAAVDKIGKQARRGHKKHTDSRRRATRTDWPMEVLERSTVGDGDRPRVIKSVNLPIKPMSIDEAALQLETSKNDFVVFRDAVTEKVSVLFKRRDENYGLISPEA